MGRVLKLIKELDWKSKIAFLVGAFLFLIYLAPVFLFEMFLGEWRHERKTEVRKDEQVEGKCSSP